ncbi:hypothetical protein MTBPR1_20244 [Candidatus Terasakiella magnetica]|uniref:DUF2336 domain-containing protein n=1 Tax=Candidatus Terasakiella magnetica TaxID=1867952 RepID=A0A1C3RGI1_9PROT|nr:DUF2336 domain-containing protein [Candidatus Terasakiella magnetica]SCA56396.1 hypothetical protein MTBPR1_20244 [Candidatus Terasakiella magnetica]
MFSSNKTATTLANRAQALRDRMDAKEKCALARDMGQALDQENLNDTQRTLAEDIISKLVEDEMVQVRAAIAEAVAGSPHLPGRIARKLAEDIAEVSIPVLALSPALEEKLLDDVINSGVAEKITAIAGRDNVSAHICCQIVASGRKGAVVRLLNNPGADISDHTMVTIVRVYGDDKKIEQAVFDRGELSNEVMETLRDLSEAHVSAFIQRYFNLPEHMVDVDRGRNLLERNQNDRRNSNWWDSKQGVL